MVQIQDYLSKTKSAVQKIFEAYNSYLDLLEYPERPAFTFWGEPDSIENKIAYEKWRIENKELLEERHRRDDEFAFELFARAMLAGTVLQFAYNGIKMFSKNKTVPHGIVNIIQPDSEKAKFCIGRMVDDLPIGLIIYAGRNQAMHFDEGDLREPSKTIFHKLANWYSPTFKKWYVDSYFDLNNDKIINYADNILYKLDWLGYNVYEKDMLEMLKQ